MKIYYLEHSGFVVDTKERAYVIDYYKDPSGVVEQLRKEGKEMWFLATHIHHDHYEPVIETLGDERSHYVYHEDITLHRVDREHCHPMAVGDSITIDGIAITMYGSTDAGGSFHIVTDEGSIFHAGDLNWWHWLGDTPENNREAKAMQEREFHKLKGLSVDVAMIPVDARLEEAREWGLIEFLRIMQAHIVIPMHNNGPVWTPSVYVKALFEDQKYWIPTNAGDSIKLEFLLD